MLGRGPKLCALARTKVLLPQLRRLDQFQILCAFLRVEDSLCSMNRTAESIITIRLFLSSDSSDDVSETKASEDLLETKTAKKTVKEATKTKTVQLEMLSKDRTEKLANESKDTAEQETDSSDDLEERLGQETPERVDLLLSVGHTLKLALTLIDTGLDLSRELLEKVGEVSLLRSSLTRRSLLLGVASNATIRVKTTDDAVGLGKELTTVLDQRLDLSDEFLLITVLGLLGLSCADLVVDGLADGSETLQSLLDLVGELLSKLLVLLSLVLLSLDIGLGLLALDALLLSLTLRLGCRLLFRLLLGDILKKRDVTNDAALLVKDIAILIDLLALAVEDLAAGKLANDVAISVDNVTLTVYLATSKRVVASDEGFGITDNKSANSLASLVHNLAILGDSAVLELSEGTVLLATTFALRDKLSLADDVSRLASDVSITVRHASDQLLDITLNDTTVNLARLADEVTGLVDTLASKGRVVDRLLLLSLGSFPALGLTDGVTAAVENVTILIDLAALELLGVTLDNLTNLLTIVHDTAVRLDNGITLNNLSDNVAVGVDELADLVDLTALKNRSVLLLDALPFRKRLSLADDLTVSPDLAVLVRLEANELLDFTLSDLADGVSLIIGKTTLLVDNSTLEGREILLLATLPLREGLGLTNRLASLVPDGALVVRGKTNELLDLTLDDLTEEVALLVNEVTVLVDSLALQDAVILLLTTLPLREGLGLTDLLTSSVPDNTLVVRRKTNELLNLAFNDTSDEMALVVHKVTLLVNGSALENRRVLLLAVPLGDRLSLAELLASLVPDLTLVVTVEADELLELTFDNLADLVTLVVDEVALLVDSGALEDGEVERLLGSLLSFSGLLIDSFFSLCSLVLGLIGDVASDLFGLWSLALGILRELLGGLLAVLNLVLSILRKILNSLLTVGSLALSILGKIFSSLLGLCSLALDVLRNILGSLVGFRNLVLSSILALSGLALDFVGDTCSILSGSHRLQIVTSCLRLVIICNFVAGDFVDRSVSLGNITLRNLGLCSLVLGTLGLLLELLLDFLRLGDILLLLVDLGGNILLGLFGDVLGLLGSVLGLLRDVVGLVRNVLSGLLSLFGLGSDLLELVVGIGWCLSVLKVDLVGLVCCLVLNFGHIANGVCSTLGCVTNSVGSSLCCLADSVRGALSSVTNSSCHSTNSAGNAADGVSQTSRLLVLGLSCVLALLLVVRVLFLLRLSLSYGQCLAEDIA
ncbi:hypothetical protein HG531_012473 [Fusarium graminearum]|nr:hypothetical protein HG531_012473 [Fusarium graminearum]